MDELPKLPGNSFPDFNLLEFNVPHHFDWSNGYPIVKYPNVGIGKQPLDIESTAYAFDQESVRLDPSMVYGRVKKFMPPVFKPHFVMYDKKCLSFNSYIEDTINGEPRIRYCKVTYFLEDDTLTILEPTTENAGYTQGKLVKRGRFPREENGPLIHWKDLNVGIDLIIKGIKFHLYSCDKFTREFLRSQGMIINENESCPEDLYTKKRKAMILVKSHKTSNETARKIQLEGKILRFKALWDDEGREFTEQNVYKINFHLEDNTIEIYEIREPNCGKLWSPKFMKRTKVPKCLKEVKDSMPVYLEVTEQDVPLYYTSTDFIVGKTLNIFHRRFLIIDCDNYTRSYFESCLKIIQPDPIPLKKTKKIIPTQKLPPYMGFGTPEDSLGSWYGIIPKPPIKDEMRLLINMNKRLRYTAVLDWVNPDDDGRQFIIEYRLTDGCIKITEPKLENSGHRGGGFLKFTLVPKENCDPNYPEYVTPNDFVLGEAISIFGHRFIITGMDVAVYRYMEANPEKFTEEAVNDARKHLVRDGLLTDDVKDVAEYRKREEIAEPIVSNQEINIEGYRALEVPPKDHPDKRNDCRVTFADPLVKEGGGTKCINRGGDLSVSLPSTEP